MDTPNDFLIFNARIMTPGKILSPGFTRVVDSKVTEIHDGNYTEETNQHSKTTAFDAQMQWLVPGFIDMHVHGGNEADVMDGTPNSGCPCPSDEAF